jgi:hypothetical protein
LPPPLAKLGSLGELPGTLSEMKNLDWVWIGLVLGTQLQCPKVGADLTDAVDGWVLVNDLFAHMELWFLLICISLDKG